MTKIIKIALCASVLLLAACAQEAKVDSKNQQKAGIFADFLYFFLIFVIRFC